MGLFSSKKNVNSPANGHVIKLDKINDQVFSKGLMGNGFGIINHENEVFSPIDGKISSVFPTKHAIIVEGKNGTSILIHMGLDTVEMEGRPFDVKVIADESVKTGDLLATMDSKAIRDSGRDDTIVVITPDQQDGSIVKSDVDVTSADVVFKL